MPSESDCVEWVARGQRESQANAVMSGLSISPGNFATGGAAILAMVALYTDGRQRQIPNWIVSGLALLWVVAVCFTAQLLDMAVLSGLGCGTAGLALGYVFYHFGLLGGGDGKLLGVLALWLGLSDVGLWLLATAVLGLLLVVAALVSTRGDFRARGIPFAWAMVPPASALLFARAFA